MRDFDYPDYPEKIVQGDVVARAFRLVQGRLEQIFPSKTTPEGVRGVFRHEILPPSPGKPIWQNLIQSSPTVALALGEWRGTDVIGSGFAGDLTFYVAVLLAHANPADLYLGTGQLRGVGAAGIYTAITAAFHGWRAEAVGSCLVKNLTLPPTEDWFADRALVVTAELVFQNVSLSQAGLADNLPEWDQTSPKITTNQEECGQCTLP